FKQRQQRADQTLLLFGGRQSRLRVATFEWDRTKRRHKRNDFPWFEPRTPGHRLEPFKSCRRRLIVAKLAAPPDVADNRVESIVHVMRGALIADREMWLVGDPFAQRSQDARLADAGLARQQRDLAFARAGVPPSLDQQRHLGLASDERGHAV